MARPITVGLYCVNNDLVVNVENHMAPRPPFSPAERSLYNSVKLFELDVALPESARYATRVPQITEDSADPFPIGAARVGINVNCRSRGCDEVDTVPPRMKHGPPRYVCARVMGDVPRCELR